MTKVQSITEVQTKDTADKKTDTTQTDICFKHVTFSYPNKEDNALIDVCLQFPRGSHTAIVGESRSEKNTLASLMMGFWHPKTGTIRLGGENEKLIQEALDELQCNKTVIIIAHRLNTIQDMELIVVMDKGQVVFQELMKDCSLYCNMPEMQKRVSKWQLKEE